jgi:uncharacterized C2H2 Zn-finger protein
MARARQAASAKKSAEATTATGGEAFTCPECGREFSRAASLGAHRRRAHGVPGASKGEQSKSRSTRDRRRTTQANQKTARSAPRSSQPGARRDGEATVDRDALLATLFPNGVPPRERVIREVTGWLDQAERLVKLA